MKRILIILLFLSGYCSYGQLLTYKGVIIDSNALHAGKFGAKVDSAAAFKFGFSGLANLDMTKYDSSTGRFENFSPTFKTTFVSAYQALGSVIKAEPPGITILSITTATAIATQAMKLIMVELPKAATITGIKYFQTTAGSYTANNYNGVGLYTVNPATGDLTLVASSTDDGNIWKASSNTWVTKAFTTPYVAVAGTYYAALLYCSSAQTTAPQIGCGTAMVNGNLIGVDFTNSIKIAGTISAQTSLPTPLASSSIVASGAVVYLALY